MQNIISAICFYIFCFCFNQRVHYYYFMRSIRIPLFLNLFLSKHIIQLTQAKSTIVVHQECTGEKQTSGHLHKWTDTYRDLCQVLKTPPLKVLSQRQNSSSLELTTQVVERGTSIPFFRYLESPLLSFLADLVATPNIPLKQQLWDK